MDQYSPIYINIPCPTTKEAQKICCELLEQELCGTAKIYPQVELFYAKKRSRARNSLYHQLKNYQY
ncbi:hypothetical protein A2572_02160 [Candidatus Collierbacteria bacterium RIFOXYD1_FULL_40_9]|uniref:Uncharacterized protein n=1 Tax=Candidatus Collierbacteria bacterium RIFOXYD1_FULL_40_9 TaxID=1817731 RepID=A0A1F5FT82_9BACT|nr:MAG: hypothetical protein A2572_02160 [Candidatus Collierbacteria bacterium RIFOXYD1_FULL_40_9]